MLSVLEEEESIQRLAHVEETLRMDEGLTEMKGKQETGIQEAKKPIDSQVFHTLIQVSQFVNGEESLVRTLSTEQWECCGEPESN